MNGVMNIEKMIEARAILEDCSYIRWDKTPQGGSYWMEVSRHMGDLIRAAKAEAAREAEEARKAAEKREEDERKEAIRKMQENFVTADATGYCVPPMGIHCDCKIPPPWDIEGWRKMCCPRSCPCDDVIRVGDKVEVIYKDTRRVGQKGRVKAVDSDPCWFWVEFSDGREEVFPNSWLRKLLPCEVA